MDNQTKEVQTTAETKGTLSFSVKYPTPMWATWVFRVEFFANKAFLFYLAGADGFDAHTIKMAILIAGTVDMFVWGIGKSLGIKPPEN